MRSQQNETSRKIKNHNYYPNNCADSQKFLNNLRPQSF